MPLPRYHHASVLVVSHDPFSGSQTAAQSLMFVVGGVTKKGVANDTWCLNLSSLMWKQYKVFLCKILQFLTLLELYCPKHL